MGKFLFLRHIVWTIRAINERRVVENRNLFGPNDSNENCQIPPADEMEKIQVKVYYCLLFTLLSQLLLLLLELLGRLCGRTFNIFF